MVKKIDFTNKKALSYVLGVERGDAWASYSHNARRYEVGLQANDKCFVEKFRDALIELGLKTWFGWRTDHKQWKTCANGKLLVLWLDEKDPAELTDIEEEIIPFLEGFYESDGTSDIEISYCKTDLPLLNITKKHLEKLNIKTTIQGPYGNETQKSYYFLYVRATSRETFKSIIIPCNKYNLR